MSNIERNYCMDENTNKIEVLDYSIRANNDGTYRVSIQTDIGTILYERARVAFGLNETRSIAFPLVIQVLNNKDEIAMNYNLNLQKTDEQGYEVESPSSESDNQ